MEDLNKNQFILLVLLVTFVTSIATGIMTSALLQEAPVEITRNINRIVEKTVETVIPGNIISTPSETVFKEVTTIVVKEEDSVVDAISKNEQAIVRINKKDVLLGIVSFYGMGVVIDKEGLIAADKKFLTNQSDTYTAKFHDGKEFNLEPIGFTKDTNFVLFKAIVPEKTSYTFSPTVLTEAEPKLGQTVISVGGDSLNSISVGRITSFNTRDSSVGTTTAKYISGIATDVSSQDLLSGSPLFNLSGNFIGMKLSEDLSRVFIPSAILKKEIEILTK